MLRASHQTLATRVVVNVVQLLLPEALALNRFWIAARLPEAAVAVSDYLISKCLQKALWRVSAAKVAELSARDLAEIGEGLR